MPDEEKDIWGRLNPREVAFIEAYVGFANGNATKAMIAAGYSERSARCHAYQFMKKPHVRDAVAWLNKQRGMTAEEVIRRLAEQARNEVSDYIVVGEDGVPRLDFHQLVEDGKAHLIEEIFTDKDGKTRYKVAPVQEALKTLAKYHKLLTEHVDLGGTVEHVIGYRVEMPMDRNAQSEPDEDEEDALSGPVDYEPTGDDDPEIDVDI